MKKLFWTIISISILALLVFYVSQVNALTKETYLWQNYEKNLSQLSGESEVLVVNFAKSNSLSNIESYLQNQNFEKVSRVKYIRILESSVAAKK